MMRIGLLPAFVLLIVSGCTTMTPTDPALQTAGPRPANVDKIVMAFLMKRWDFNQLKELEISEPREGGQWTGLIGQGMVPSWYVCVRYKRRMFPPVGYVKEGPFLVWIRDSEVVGMTRASKDHYSKHECKISMLEFSFS